MPEKGEKTIGELLSELTEEVRLLFRIPTAIKLQLAYPDPAAMVDTKRGMPC